MTPETQRYFACLIRLWQIHDQGQLVWRASLEHVDTSERIGFASLDALVRYLRLQTASDLRGAGSAAQEAE